MLTSIDEFRFVRTINSHERNDSFKVIEFVAVWSVGEILEELVDLDSAVQEVLELIDHEVHFIHAAAQICHLDQVVASGVAVQIVQVTEQFVDFEFLMVCGPSVVASVVVVFREVFNVQFFFVVDVEGVVGIRVDKYRYQRNPGLQREVTHLSCTRLCGTAFLVHQVILVVDQVELFSHGFMINHNIKFVDWTDNFWWKLEKFRRLAVRSVLVSIK